MLTDAVYLQGIVNRTKEPSKIVDFPYVKQTSADHPWPQNQKQKFLEVTFQSKNPLLLRIFLFLAVWDAFTPKGFHMAFDFFLTMLP